MSPEELALTGKIYDIQGFSVQDGPGIRTTVFEKGCPLGCKWCHSPESRAFHSQLSCMAMRCIGVEECGSCIAACPQGAISRGEKLWSDKEKREIQYIRINRNLCKNCGACTRVCFPKALFMSGEDMSVEQILDRVLKDKSFFERSGGGVTVSGGECLSQPRFTLGLLKALKENGIHTAVDTTGHVPWEILRQSLEYTDLYLWDLKHMDSQRHRDGTGVGCELIHENALRLARSGGRFQIRIPVIPEYNDSEENIRASCRFCQSLNEISPGAVVLVQLLPYHKLGAMKYDRLGMPYTLSHLEPPSDEYMHTLKTIAEGYGLNCRIH